MLLINNTLAYKLLLISTVQVYLISIVEKKEQFMVSQNNNQNNGKINDGRIEINGKVYQTVAYRLAAFRAKYPVEAGWRIKTKCLQREGEKIVFQAAIKNPEGQVVATGHAEEKRDASFINRTSAMENAETSATRRP